MSYFKLVFKTAIREPIIWVATALLAVLLSVCSVIPYYLFGSDLLRQTVNVNYKTLSESMANGSYEDAPAQILKDVELRLQYLSSAANATISSDFYAALSQLYSLDEEASSAGSLVGSTYNEAVAAKKYAETMSMAGELPEYDSSIQLPAILLVSLAPSTMPQFVLSVPAIAIVFVISKITSRKKLLGSDAIPADRAILSRSAAGIAICFMSLPLSFMPTLFIAFFKNGLGDSTYPMVFLKGGSVVETTAGEAALWTIVLIAVMWLFLSVVGICITCLSRNTLVGVLGVPILALIPSAPSYYSASSPFGSLLMYVPLSYFCPWVIAGSFGSFPYVDITPAYALDAWMGCLILGIWTSSALVLSTLLAFMRQHIYARKVKPTVSRGIILNAATVAYGRNMLLFNASLRVDKGEVIGLIAPNGSGKTTLLTILSGRTKHMRKGTLRINGLAPTDEVAYAHSVYYAPSDASLLYPFMSARFHIQAIQILYGQSSNSCDLAGEVGMIEFLDKPVRALSQGMVRQLSLAMAIASKAPYVLLDEPINALDPNKSELAGNCIQKMAKRGVGVIVSSHQPEEMDRICTRFAFLTNKTLKSIEAGNTQTCRELFHTYFG